MGYSPPLLRAVARAALAAALDPGRVERAADDLVPDAGAGRCTLAPADQHDRVLLQVVPLAGDVAGHLGTARQAHPGDLAQRGVGLRGGHRCRHACRRRAAGANPSARGPWPCSCGPCGRSVPVARSWAWASRLRSAVVNPRATGDAGHPRAGPTRAYDHTLVGGRFSSVRARMARRTGARPTRLSAVDAGRQPTRRDARRACLSPDGGARGVYRTICCGWCHGCPNRSCA